MTHSLSVVPPPARTPRPVAPLRDRLWRIVRDVAYGVHAGNAIRHGLPAPRRAGDDAPRPPALRAVR